MPRPHREHLLTRLSSVLRSYAVLGFNSFGGPGVHVIILRERFVHKLKWVDERTFLDLFALGNALPGPGSTQLAFSIAVVKHGVLPGILAFLCWSLPGALGMAGLAAGISTIPSDIPPLALALLSGLNAAAVGLIALAAYQLGTAASTDKITLLLVWLSASFGICYHAPWMYPTLIAAGGMSTLLWDFRRQWLFVPARRILGAKRDERVELADIPPQRPAPTISPDVRPIPPSITHTSTFPSPPDSPISSPVPGQDDPSALNLAESSSTTTHLRRVVATPDSDPEALPPPTATTDLLQVVSYRSAWALIGCFVVLLVVPLAARGGLSHAGKTVPRELDVSCSKAKLMLSSSRI